MMLLFSLSILLNDSFAHCAIQFLEHSYNCSIFCLMWFWYTIVMYFALCLSFIRDIGFRSVTDILYIHIIHLVCTRLAMFVTLFETNKCRSEKVSCSFFSNCAFELKFLFFYLIFARTRDWLVNLNFTCNEYFFLYAIKRLQGSKQFSAITNLRIQRKMPTKRPA